MENQLLPRSQENLRQLEISLYRELLECLEQETQALTRAQEEAILNLATNKEAILKRLLEVKQERHAESGPLPPDADAGQLSQLKEQVAGANERNRQIITASLEVIQDFLALFQPPGPGTYRPEGQMQNGSGMALFHRQA